MVAYVVKREGAGSQMFDPHKLYQSVYRASMMTQATPGQAQLTAERVTREVQHNLRTKPEVTSGDVRREATAYLQYYDPYAAYVYGNASHPTRRDPRAMSPYQQPTAPRPSSFSSVSRPNWMNIGKNNNWGDK